MGNGCPIQMGYFGNVGMFFSAFFLLQIRRGRRGEGRRGEEEEKWRKDKKRIS